MAGAWRPRPGSVAEAGGGNGYVVAQAAIGTRKRPSRQPVWRHRGELGRSRRRDDQGGNVNARGRRQPGRSLANRRREVWAEWGGKLFGNHGKSTNAESGCSRRWLVTRGPGGFAQIVKAPREEHSSNAFQELTRELPKSSMAALYKKSGVGSPVMSHSVTYCGNIVCGRFVVHFVPSPAP